MCGKIIGTLAFNKVTLQWIVETYSQRNWVEVFRTAISYNFHNWLKDNADLFTKYKASFGYIWA